MIKRYNKMRNYRSEIAAILLNKMIIGIGSLIFEPTTK
jgi:hypothetical protein